MTARCLYWCDNCRAWFSTGEDSALPSCTTCGCRVTRLVCTRCGHTWYPRRSTPPGICPKCKTPYWNRVRVDRRPSPRRRTRGNASGDDKQ